MTAHPAFHYLPVNFGDRDSYVFVDPKLADKLLPFGITIYDVCTFLIDFAHRLSIIKNLNPIILKLAGVETIGETPVVQADIKDTKWSILMPFSGGVPRNPTLEYNPTMYIEP